MLILLLKAVAMNVPFQGDGHAICPVMLGDARLAVEMADELLGKLSRR